MHRQSKFALLTIGVFSLNAMWSPATALEPCVHEDGSGQHACTWDASLQGNGHGQSFDVIDGQVFYHSEPVTEVHPPITTPTEAEAWALWDAVGASSLLPNAETRVVYSGHSLTPYPLMPGTITVWDAYGHHYLFTFTH